MGVIVVTVYIRLLASTTFFTLVFENKIYGLADLKRSMFLRKEAIPFLESLPILSSYV